MSETPYEKTLTEFLDAMDEPDFDAALALFAEEATYTRPLLTPPGTPLGVGTLTYHGKAEIAAFMQERGSRDMRQRQLVAATRDNHLFAEGIIEFGDGSPNMFPLFHLEFDGDGLITRFVSLR
jgi:ketosteroid isomerase-like protein